MGPKSIKTVFMLFLLSCSAFPEFEMGGFGFGVAYVNSGLRAKFTDDGEYYSDLKRLSGLGVAVFTRWFAYNRLHLITQIEYIKRGYRDIRISFDAQGNKIGVWDDLSAGFYYISITPLVVKYKVFEKKISPYIGSGPLLGFVIREKLDRDIVFNGKPIFSHKHDNFSFGLSSNIGIAFALYTYVRFDVEFFFDFDFNDTNSEIEAWKVRHNSIGGRIKLRFND